MSFCSWERCFDWISQLRKPTSPALGLCQKIWIIFTPLRGLNKTMTVFITVVFLPYSWILKFVTRRTSRILVRLAVWRNSQTLPLRNFTIARKLFQPLYGFFEISIGHSGRSPNIRFRKNLVTLIGGTSGYFPTELDSWALKRGCSVTEWVDS